MVGLYSKKCVTVTEQIRPNGRLSRQQSAVSFTKIYVTLKRHSRRGSDLVLGGIYRRRLLSLGERAYGMPSRLQDAAGSRNRRMDAALEAVGFPLATELRDSCSWRFMQPRFKSLPLPVSDPGVTPNNCWS